MDGDPGVEPELDSLSLTLPLPYRVALVTVLGMPSPFYLFLLYILTGNRSLGVGRESAVSFAC